MKTTTEKIADLYNAGVPPKDIHGKLGLPETTVRSALRRCREKQLIPPRKICETRQATCKRHAIKMGVLWSAMDQQNVSQEVREWVLARAKDQGYETLAEWAVDLMVDEYYQSIGPQSETSQ